MLCHHAEGVRENVESSEEDGGSLRHGGRSQHEGVGAQHEGTQQATRRHLAYTLVFVDFLLEKRSLTDPDGGGDTYIAEWEED